MVTLRDVAGKAGVSPKTVSRVVNDDPAVSADTREQVLQIIKDMNYVPDHAARMMRSSTSNVVGLMTDVVATTPYSVDIVRGAQSALRSEARTLLIANSEGDAELETEFWRMFRAHKVAGVIYATMFHRPIDLGTPHFERGIVLANCFALRKDRMSIVPDDEAGGYTQAAHLLKLGHRRIGIISLNPVIRATSLRAAGYRTAFQEAGVSFNVDLEKAGETGPMAHPTMIAYDVAREMLSRPDRPTAIICGNDKVAMQVYAAAAQLGISIPNDLSVMGYDDMTIIAESLRPSLTTVGLPYFEIGRRAVEIMNRVNDEGVVKTEEFRIPCPLVIRESCRPLV